MRRLAEVRDRQGVQRPRGAEATGAALADVAQALATAYSSWPGYREEWRPTP